MIVADNPKVKTEILYIPNDSSYVKSVNLGFEDFEHFSDSSKYCFSQIRDLGTNTMDITSSIENFKHYDLITVFPDNKLGHQLIYTGFENSTNEVDDINPYNAPISSDYSIMELEKIVRSTRLLTAYVKEFTRYRDYITDIEKAHIQVPKLISKISQIPFSDFEVELAPNNSIVFTLQLFPDTFLLITKPFHDMDDMGENEVIYGLFRNKECIVNNARPIDDVIKGAKELVG